MTDGERRDWLLSAWEALRDIPADLLDRGCRAARLKADHPAKIVPAIMAEIEEAWKWRRESPAPALPSLPAPDRRHVSDRRGEPMSQKDTDELNLWLENMGASVRYRTDGTKYPAEQQTV